jgi:hypothetical protein
MAAIINIAAIEFYEGIGVVAIVATITSRTKSVIMPIITFLFSILPLSPQKECDKAEVILTVVRHNFHRKLVLC